MDPSGPLIQNISATPHPPWVSTPLDWELGTFSGKFDA